MGEKTFVQCAGFLRIPDGDNPLDNTAVHPESYEVAEELLKIDYTKEDLKTIAEKLDVGLPTFTGYNQGAGKAWKRPKRRTAKANTKARCA